MVIGSWVIMAFRGIGLLSYGLIALLNLICIRMHTFKKSLGQHFLKDADVIRKIIDVLLQHPFNNLLEVGPGGGALTKDLIQLKDVDFKAVELDTEKSAFLMKTYPQIHDKIIVDDFLTIERPMP